WLAFVFTVYAGIAMVTNAPFYSGKTFALGRSVPFWVILVLVGAFVFVSSDPPIVLFGLFVVYGLSGWFIMAWSWRRARELTRRRHQEPEGAEPPVAQEPSFGASHGYPSPELGGHTDKHDTPKPPLPCNRRRGRQGRLQLNQKLSRSYRGSGPGWKRVTASPVVPK